MTFTGMGPDVPSPRLDPNCQCDCHRQPGVMHVAACCSAKAPASDAVTLAALPEVQALIAAAYEVAAHWIEAVPQSLPARDEYARHIRRLTPAEAIAAREARDAQMRAEGRVAGLREAAEIAARRYGVCEDAFAKGMGPEERHCALEAKHIETAIRALADKIEGEADA